MFVCIQILYIFLNLRLHELKQNRKFAVFVLSFFPVLFVILKFKLNERYFEKFINGSFDSIPKNSKIPQERIDKSIVNYLLIGYY